MAASWERRVRVDGWKKAVSSVLFFSRSVFRRSRANGRRSSATWKTRKNSSRLKSLRDRMSRPRKLRISNLRSRKIASAGAGAPHA